MHGLTPCPVGNCTHPSSSDFGAHVPAGTPAQCASNYFVLDDVTNVNKSNIIKTIEHTTLGECCAACTAANTVNETACHAYNFGKLQKTCTLHGETSFSDFRPSLFASAGFFTGLGLPAYLQRAAGKLSTLLNGGDEGMSCIESWCRVCEHRTRLYRIPLRLTW